ncbi:hypothetical protein [Dichotomicrobium thermohalophilum]|uniref:Glutamine amidotransferase n=1 Tax=Dichotomicrobium thermohalophilum TaxID=933063 RepID=A0A397PJI2_9HYPH|nr:hypothetical protein [Dichotomicrobium thermohalophilum]RIA47435.1 hypothetical protein BXY53_2514 [Dichotomicrobium thermohalophilum]
MNWSIEFSPFLPQSVLIGAGVLVALAVIGHLIRRQRGAFLRLLAGAFLLLALANPVLKQEEREPLRNIAVVVIDESSSQKIAGRPERTNAIRQELSERLQEIPNLDIRFVRAGPGGDAEREETRLFDALNRGMADVPAERLAGVFMVTDGQIHDVPREAAEVNFGAPVHAMLTGEEGEFDRHIKIHTAPRFGLVGSTQTAEIEVVQTGADDQPQTATLTVRREGEGPETLNVGVGQTIRLPFRFTRAGPTYMEVALAPVEGELTTANNRIVMKAEGVRENLRVLLVSGEPHAGERTWRNLLRSDASVDLVHFTILRPPEKQDGTPINQLSLIAFPTRELFSEKLDEFDLIIFDRYQRRGVLPLIYLDNVSRYVREGGAVLIAAGPDFASPLSLYRTPLSRIVPARPTGRIIERAFKPRVSDKGERHPVTADLPGANDADEPEWGRWFRTIDVQNAEGDVLMTGPDGTPLLVLARQGEGRVGMFLSDHAWLWARGYEGGGPYADILRRISHWLMKEPDLEEESLDVSAGRQSLTITRRSMSDSIGPVEVNAPDGEQRSVTLEQVDDGRWRANVTAETPGLYRVTSGDLAAVAHVGAVNSRELTEVTASREPLAPVLDETGGGAFWLGGAEEPAAAGLPRISMLSQSRKMHGDDWAGLRDRQAYMVTGVKYTPLYAGPLALALLLGLLALMWYREGR